MYCKLIDENNVHFACDNDKIMVGSEEMVFSNVNKFLELNPDIAKANGFYPYKDSDIPEYNPLTAELHTTYSLTNNEIVAQYEVAEVAE